MIKTHSGQYATWIANYQQSIRNLAACGIDSRVLQLYADPRLDAHRSWNMSCRTAPALRFRSGSLSPPFELHILKRPGAEADYSEEEQRQAGGLFQGDERSRYR
ncbi:mannonate dehydratase [Klebsiella pneumoniae subsp. pneumoniae]|nr:mannonate dehydratase [Klebsiella pneumoniae subsp. pneumoniae]